MATKSQVVSWMGVSLGLVQGLLRKVYKLGGGDEDVRKLVTPEGETLLAKFAQMIVGGVARQTFKVVIDYSRDLSQMIVAGKYDWVNSDITQEHFPINGNGKVEEELVLFHFGKDMSSNAVLAEMDRAGYKLARIEELLALGESQPDLQKQFSIVALGFVWRDQDGDRRVPCLGWDGSERFLSLDYFGIGWDGRCRFAALRK